MLIDANYIKDLTSPKLTHQLQVKSVLLPHVVYPDLRSRSGHMIRGGLMWIVVMELSGMRCLFIEEKNRMNDEG